MLKRIINCFILLISFYFIIDYVSLFPTYSMIKPVINTKTYSNDYFSFEYPENWSYQDFDSFISFYDEWNDIIANIWIDDYYKYEYPIGEDKESYAKVLSQANKRQSQEILELSHLKIDGYNTDKLITKCKIGFKNYKFVKYIIDFSPYIQISAGGRTRKTDFWMPGLNIIVNSFHFYD